MLRRTVPKLARSLATQVATPSPAATSTSQDPRTNTKLRNDWSKREVKEIYETPLLELVYRAASVHRMHHDPSKIQLCTLMNIKSTFDYISPSFLLD
jgi:biotin synthase